MGFLNSVSIAVYTFFKVRDSLVLVLLGICLLSGGLHAVSQADAPNYEGWPLAAQKTAPGATGRLAPQSFNTGIAQPAFARFVAERTGNAGVAERTDNIGVAENSAFLGAHDPLEARDAEQPANPGIGLAEEKDVPYDDTLVRNAVGNLYRLIEGAFGALVVVAAGIGAIVAGVVGAYKAAFALFLTAVGAFILRAYVSLFFGTDYVSYDNGGAGGGELGF
jgi:hypothetical protein